MKVCILAPIHIWSDVRVFKKQAISLHNMGFEVTQICSCVDEEINLGIKLKPSFIYNKNRIIRILLTPFLFIQCLNEKADIYHCHNPDTLITVFILKLLRKNVIYDTHEDFSLRILFKEWIPKPLRKLISLLISTMEKIASYCSDHTFVTQKRMLSRFSKNTSVLGNLPIVPCVEPISSNVKENREFRLVYLGLINESRGILDVVQALGICNREANINVRLWLIGKIEDKFMSVLQKESGWGYVDYLSYMPQDKAFEKVKASDLGMIYIRDIGDHRYTDPNKIYEYMMFKKAFIASDFDEWKDKVNGIDCGWFLQPNFPEGLSDLIINIIINESDDIINKGNAGYSFIKKNNWNDEVKLLEKVYKTILDV